MLMNKDDINPKNMEEGIIVFTKGHVCSSNPRMVVSLNVLKSL